MKIIGKAIHDGLITLTNMTQEALIGHFISPCSLCKHLGSTVRGHRVCNLFDSPFNSVDPEPSVPTSAASLVSVITKCKLREEYTC